MGDNINVTFNHLLERIQYMKSYKFNNIQKSFQYFIKLEYSSGILLFLCAVIAITLANSDLSTIYNAVLHTNITLGFKDANLSMPISHFINDGLMAIFFFVVGMEIKKEVLIGELQSFKTDKLEFAYYQPKFTTSLSLQYIAADKLIFDLTPTFKAGMKTMYMGEEKTLDPIIDINLNAEYRYSDQLSVFVKLNNLAFQRYEQYYNYPSQRFMGMIGASMSF